MTEGDRERTKLSATALSNVGVAFFTVGFLTPFASYLYALPIAPSPEYLLGLTGIWCSVGGVLHVLARATLKDLDL